MCSVRLHQLPLVGLVGKRLCALTQWPVVLITSVGVTSLLLLAQHLGGLQRLELVAFDRMLRLRPDQGTDPRLLVVGITEPDIHYLKRWPLSDQTIAQLMNSLQQYQPKAIGLDLLRDFPNEPGHAELMAQLQHPKVIAITSIGNTETESVSAPSGVPKERVGFNDIATDPDGTVRRNLMFAGNGKTTLTSFSLRLALIYLADQGISPQLTKAKEYQLGKTVFVKLRENSGGYQAADARGYQILLNYRSPQNIARQVTLTQVLTKRVDPTWVKDKIVLIGATGPTFKDLFLTPYSVAESGNHKIPGVMVHALEVSQLLSSVLDGQPLFWFWSPWVEGLWTFGWAVAGGFLAWRIQHPLTLGLGSVVLLSLLGGFSYGFFTYLYLWVPAVAPALALMITGGYVVIYQTHQAGQQKQMVMQLLGQQTSPEVAAALWNARDRLIQSGMLPPQTLTATVLFIDLKNFSHLAEATSPAVLMAWLNQYLSAMTDEVQTHGGIVNKFTGDGLMAVFGVPVPHMDLAEIAADALGAVSCALAMGDRLKRLNSEWQQPLPTLEMRVGIFTGPVTVGSLGGKNRLEYGVIGNSVNIASRLESYAKDLQVDICRVLIAKETLIHLQGQFQVESWGVLELKGKQQPVEVYRVIGWMPQSPLSFVSQGEQTNQGKTHL